MTALAAPYGVVIDLKNAYWAVSIDCESSKKLGILFKQQGWPLSGHHLRRLPQGFASSTPLYQKKMGEFLSQWEGQSYYDDTLFVGGKEDKTKKRHTQALK
eukprot:GHVN01050291.1.p1 GENE.GHVN01050291.1~~GHVN01050291.1.p1  ORF type:complete len:101 (+),score=12.41 GHVN01050291.1:97-399(+)